MWLTAERNSGSQESAQVDGYGNLVVESSQS